ncbi:MAG TPA: hypothetical protein VM223_20870 [Planctomycetota bacterium]|nr:hypothetical protein [Planctomycetota bacterium]
MNLQYKPDWEETQQRLTAWWNHEYFGRCALAVGAPLDNPPARPKPREPETIEDKWYNLDLIAEWNEYGNGRVFFGGER